MKLSKVYRYGFLILLELILLIVLVTTIPLWWLKHIKNLIIGFGGIIKDVMS